MATKYAPHTMTAAAARAKAKVGKSNAVGMCLAECVNPAYNSPYNLPSWRFGGNGRPWAVNHWLDAVDRGKVVKTSDPAKIPAGALAYMAKVSGGKLVYTTPGHVFIGAGGGNAYSTDRPSNGKWGKVSIRSIEAAWGMKLVGYILVTGDGITLTDKPAAVTPKPAPKPTTQPVTDWLASSLFIVNAASRKAKWTSRSSTLGKDILASGADFIICQELYSERRPLLSAQIKSKYVHAGSYNGRVIYIKRATWGRAPGTVKKAKLGRATKEAVGVKVRHTASGKKLNLIDAHLTWEHDRGEYRKEETQQLAKWARDDFPANATIIAGDFNAPYAARGRADEVGLVLAGAGFRDAGGDVNAKESYRLMRAFVTASTKVTGINTFATTGSDHRNVLVKFKVPA
jgi:endonuclease/exonuclease/phosphatase (EEP) superfamily protein YafD